MASRTSVKGHVPTCIKYIQNRNQRFELPLGFSQNTCGLLCDYFDNNPRCGRPTGLNTSTHVNILKDKLLTNRARVPVTDYARNTRHVGIIRTRLPHAMLVSHSYGITQISRLFQQWLRVTSPCTQTSKYIPRGGVQGDAHHQQHRNHLLVLAAPYEQNISSLNSYSIRISAPKLWLLKRPRGLVRAWIVPTTDRPDAIYKHAAGLDQTLNPKFLDKQFPRIMARAMPSILWWCARCILLNHVSVGKQLQLCDKPPRTVYL